MAMVLVVEDDDHVRGALIHELTSRQHAVRSVSRAMDALREVTRERPDIVILDLGLPDLDGAEALKMLRGVSDVPVVIATARDQEGEIIRLLNAGADDYLIKPFSGAHLGARIEAVLRRSKGSGPPEDVLCVGGLRVDVARRRALLNGAPLELTRMEFDLLAYLAASPDRVVSRKELISEVWNQSYGDDQTIDVHLSWLRRKLGERAAAPRYIHTVRGVGVRLAPPDTE